SVSCPRVVVLLERLSGSLARCATRSGEREAQRPRVALGSPLSEVARPLSADRPSAGEALELVMGIEPMTSSLPRRCSTTELHQRAADRRTPPRTPPARGSRRRAALRAGAGDGNRTHVTSLEGWSSTIELHPHSGRPGPAIGPQGSTSEGQRVSGLSGRS